MSLLLMNYLTTLGDPKLTAEHTCRHGLGNPLPG